MTLSELKQLRFRAPYVIATAFALLFFLITLPLDKAQAANAVVVWLVAMLAAYLYGGLEIGRGLWKHEMRHVIGPQIQNVLIDMVPADLNVTPQERQILLQDEVYKSLTGVFWEAVDRDPQVSALKPHFYANGAVYSTAIDVYVLGLLFAVLYTFAFLVTWRSAFLVVTLALVLLALISRWAIVPLRRRKHLALSMQQLDLLRRNQRPFIEGRYRDLVIERRRAGLFDDN